MSSWFRFDDGMPDHPKVIGLSDRAFRVHVTAMAYCSRMETSDLHQTAAKRLHRFTAAIARELETAGLWDRTVDGWVIHNWSKKQRTPDEIAAIREARREAGRRGGLKSGQSRRGEATEDAS